MDLYEDGSMDVTEKINVNFTQSRHGIYRTIPYYNDSGRYTIIENLKADGDQYSAYDEGGNYQLRIGSPNSTLI
jgi:hypothetical protein